MKNVNDLIQEFVSRVSQKITDMYLYGNNTFKSSLLIGTVNEMGLKCIDTNGLPFNGTTYEIYREVEMQGHIFKETVGHFKYIYEIYGNGVIICIYDSSCIGGTHLNGDEAGRYIYRNEILKRR